MGLDEGDLEAADEETEDEKLVGAMREGLAQRLDDRLVLLARERRCRYRFAPDHHGDERNDQDQRGEGEQRRLPAIGLDEGLAERRENELADVEAAAVPTP